MKKGLWKACAFIFVCVITVPVVRAQPDAWTGTGGDNFWTTGGNWQSGLPGTGNTAYFNSGGNGVTSISLGGTTQSIGNLQFDTGAVSYLIGTGNGDTINPVNNNISASIGTISVTSGVFNSPQEIDATLAFSNLSPLITNASGTSSLTLGAVGTSASLFNTNSTPTSTTFLVSGGATININDAITGPMGGTIGASSASGGLQLQQSGANPSGTIALNSSASVFSGVSNLNSTAGNLIVQIGASSVTTGATLVSGPFGISTIAFNGNGTQSFVQAVGAARTVANPYVFVAGETFNNAASGAQNLTFSGAGSFVGSSRTLTFNNSSTTPYTISFGAAPGSSTFSLNTSSVANVAFDAVQNVTLVLNDVIQNIGTASDTISFNPIGNNTPQGTALITGANTFSGGTTFNNQTSGTLGAIRVELGVSSVGDPGALTSGPFGTGTVTFNAAAVPPILEAFGADRTVGNALTMTSGFWAANPSAAADPTGNHNLTLTGNIADSSGRILTNNMAAGTSLTLGLAASPSTLTINTAVAGFQSQNPTGGLTVINDLVTGTGGGILVQVGGTVQLTNANTYAGTTSVTGGTLLVTNASGSATGTSVVTLTGSGTVGSGGILAGTGSISGNLTVGSTTAGSQGGIVSPGNGGAGTLNVGSATLDPLGRYAFDYNGTDTTAGSGINDLLNGSGFLTLPSGGTFDLNLSPLNAPPTTTQSYTLATFAGGIIGGSGDVTSDFTFSGNAGSDTPTVSVQGNSLILTLTAAAVPEPGGLALLGLAAVGAIRRRRK